jgi:hypothetical protein
MGFKFLYIRAKYWVLLLSSFPLFKTLKTASADDKLLTSLQGRGQLVQK